MGATLIEVDAAPFSSPNHFVHYSEHVARQLDATEPNGAYWANQFDNLANRAAHYDATAREIWSQTEGNIDAFICAVGSGGTLTGISTYLREQKPEVQIGLADPGGAALYNWFTKGQMTSEGSSITEGIGVARITGNLEGFTPDYSYRIADAEFLPILFDLVQEQGLSLGGSSGINLAGAVRLARDLGPGKTIVTVLCDPGTRYASRLYDPAFLRSKGLPVPSWIGAQNKVPA